ncbi:MAG: S8 family serine peptidase [Hyphomicrobiaceae bacterium]
MRTTLALLILIFVFGAPTYAQKTPSNARLRALLEKNFNKPKPSAKTRSPARPATRSIAPVRQPAPTTAAPAAPSPKELLIIRPGGKVERVPVKKIPDRRSDAAPDKPASSVRPVADENPLSDAWNYLRSLWQPTPPPGGKPLTFSASATNPPKPPAARALAPRIKTAQASKRMRRSKAFGVVPDVYIVHFKNTATEEQILNVVRKYDLDVVGKVPALGLIYVKRTKPVSTAPSGGTRSLSRPRTEKPPAPSPQKPQDVLNPDFLQKLRKEPGVNAATVHSTIAPKTLPRSTGLTIKENGRAFTWTWRPGVEDDGNWGLKRMRMPLAWRILKSHRAAQPARAPVTMGFLDSGFSYHGHLTYNVVHGLKDEQLLPFSGASCEESHGTHVAGIAGAAHGRGRGIDGMVPNAVIDAIPVQADDVLHGLNAGVSGLEGQHTMLFVTAVKDLVEYLENNPVKNGGKRVINISLGFNWRTVSNQEDLTKDFANGDLVGEHKKSVVISFASMLQQWLKPFEKDTLFVIAAGNDSDGLDPPLHAKWSSPFSYLGLEPSETFQRAPNFIVVEAVGRDGHRASFSNGGGQVSAPGIDVMSTIGGRGSNYAICDGTSQAAPHVTALAAILMEVAPTKTPSEIVDIIASSAIPDPDGRTAPRVDALEAVITAEPKLLSALADFNGDGTVDAIDLKLYRRHQVAMTTVFKSTLGSYFFDHNDNGQVEDNEHWYPRIDLNGSGRIDVSDNKKGCLNGRPVTDLDVMKKAWASSAPRTFEQAAIDAGLINSSNIPTGSIIASTKPKGCTW